MTREEAIKIVEHFDDTLWQIDNKVTIGKIADAIQVLVNAEADYTEQMRQLNEEWKENLAIQRQMLIDKATEWFANYLFEIGYPDDWVRHNRVWMNGEERFRKAMEESK